MRHTSPIAIETIGVSCPTTRSCFRPDRPPLPRPAGYVPRPGRSWTESETTTGAGTQFALPVEFGQRALEEHRAFRENERALVRTRAGAAFPRHGSRRVGAADGRSRVPSQLGSGRARAPRDSRNLAFAGPVVAARHAPPAAQPPTWPSLGLVGKRAAIRQYRVPRQPPARHAARRVQAGDRPGVRRAPNPALRAGTAERVK